MNPFVYFSRVSQRGDHRRSHLLCLIALVDRHRRHSSFCCCSFSACAPAPQPGASRASCRSELRNRLDAGDVLPVPVHLLVGGGQPARRARRRRRMRCEIHVVAKQWMWKVQQPNGVREINEIHAPIEQAGAAGDDLGGRDPQPVPAGAAHQAGRAARPHTYLWFTARQARHLSLLCAEFCGTEHSRMTGRFVMMTQADTRAGVASQPADRKVSPHKGEDAVPLARLLRLPRRQTSTVHAPDLHGIYGRQVHLTRRPRRHRRRGLSARLDPAAAARRRRRLSSRSCRASRASRARISMVRLLAYLKSLAGRVRQQRRSQ